MALKSLIRGFAQLWVFKCIQELMFLHPGIQQHPKINEVLQEYRDLQLRSEETNDFLMVRMLLPACPSGSQ